MKFFDYTLDILKKELKSKKDIFDIISIIEEKSKIGKIAFLPCSRYARSIIEFIKKEKTYLLDFIIGCFDKNENVNFTENIDTKLIKDLTNYLEDISLIVIASNTYYKKEETLIKKLNIPEHKILKLSYFDFCLTNIKTEKIIDEIRNVYNLLEDEKSKITYLIVWLSKVLNDETLTYLFEMEKEIVLNEPFEYKNYKIKYMDDICKIELLSELYEMRYVKPEKGDIVFDIGGYKGDTAIYFASKVREEGHVYSFEPININCKHLNENILNNNLQNIITCINMGCSDHTSISKAISIDCGAPWSFVSEEAGNIDIKLITIDDFVEENNIKKLNFIKMDVEGFEANVLKGAQKTISKYNPKIVVPLYHNTLDLINILKIIDELGNYKFYLRCKMEGPYSINLYCRPI